MTQLLELHGGLQLVEQRNSLAHAREVGVSEFPREAGLRTVIRHIPLHWRDWGPPRLQQVEYDCRKGALVRVDCVLQA